MTEPVAVAGTRDEAALEAGYTQSVRPITSPATSLVCRIVPSVLYSVLLISSVNMAPYVTQLHADPQQPFGGIFAPAHDLKRKHQSEGKNASPRFQQPGYLLVNSRPMLPFYERIRIAAAKSSLYEPPQI